MVKNFMFVIISNLGVLGMLLRFIFVYEWLRKSRRTRMNTRLFNLFS